MLRSELFSHISGKDERYFAPLVGGAVEICTRMSITVWKI